MSCQSVAGSSLIQFSCCNTNAKAKVCGNWFWILLIVLGFRVRQFRFPRAIRCSPPDHKVEDQNSFRCSIPITICMKIVLELLLNFSNATFENKALSIFSHSFYLCSILCHFRFSKFHWTDKFFLRTTHPAPVTHVEIDTRPKKGATA